jgi:iron complex transport system ATP-binding protein
MSAPIITVKNLSLQISGNQILTDLSLNIDAGDYVSIVGPNGAGKTTLIKCIAGIYQNWTGSILINGIPFSEHTPRALAKRQSYVPQAEGRSTPLTVDEFITMSRYPHLSPFTTLKPDDFEAINLAIEQAGLQNFRHRKMNTLSGGERQMTFIAAALAQGTKILLLDEPATFLDYRHQAEVATLLKSACREHGITVVAVHHDINTAAACSDYIHAIKNGSVAVSGPPGEICCSEILHAIYDTAFTCNTADERELPFAISGGAL